MDELGRIDLTQYTKENTSGPIVLLDNVRSAYNVGSIFRSADCFGISKIFLCGITCDIEHRDVQKTALGAEISVPSDRTSDIKILIASLKTLQYKIIGVEQTHNSIPLQDFRFEDEKIAFILGNEVEGVSEDALSLCDFVIEIPQNGAKHSLNISNAAAIVFYSFRTYK